jgi:hypothetical protein
MQPARYCLMAEIFIPASKPGCTKTLLNIYLMMIFANRLDGRSLPTTFNGEGESGFIAFPMQPYSIVSLRMTAVCGECEDSPQVDLVLVVTTLVSVFRQDFL